MQAFKFIILSKMSASQKKSYRPHRHGNVIRRITHGVRGLYKISGIRSSVDWFLSRSPSREPPRRVLLGLNVTRRHSCFGDAAKQGVTVTSALAIKLSTSVSFISGKPTCGDSWRHDASNYPIRKWKNYIKMYILKPWGTSRGSMCPTACSFRAAAELPCNQ